MSTMAMSPTQSSFIPDFLNSAALATRPGAIGQGSVSTKLHAPFRRCDCSVSVLFGIARLVNKACVCPLVYRRAGLGVESHGHLVKAAESLTAAALSLYTMLFK